MCKFNYELLANDEITTVCVNKNKYTKEQALELAAVELDSVIEYESLTVYIGYVRFGFYLGVDGDTYNGWHINYGQKERKYKTDVEVWVVEAI